MRISESYASSAADTDGYANDVTASSGTAFTLAADETPDSVAHKIIITPSGSVTGNYGISGKDANGATISETLATNTTNAVTSVNYYMSDIVVTAPSGLGAETVDIGWTAAAVTPAINITPYLKQGYFAMGIAVEATGTPAYSLQQSYGGEWFNHASIATKTASADGSLSFPVSAVRLIFTAASTVVMNLVLPG
jgi:hypothetical protein